MRPPSTCEIRWLSVLWTDHSGATEKEVAVKIGVVFPHAETGTDPAAIRDFAQAVEQLGFTHILAYDHVVGADPDREGGWSGPYT